MHEPVGVFLGFLGVGYVDEGVIDLDEVDVPLKHLPGKPFVTVDISLGREREPGLDPKVAKAKLFIKEVKVKDPLGAVGELEDRLAFAVKEFHSTAGFHDAENRHKPEWVPGRFFLDDLLDQLLFAVMALKEQVRYLGILCHPFGMIDQPLGLKFHKRNEIPPSHSEPIINKRVQLGIAADRVVSFEDHSIKTGQREYNEVRESFEKAVHGVLLQWRCGNYHLTAKRLFC